MTPPSRSGLCCAFLAPVVVAIVLAALSSGCGGHSAKSRSPGWIYVASQGTNELEVTEGASAAAIASYQAALWWWIERTQPYGAPTGFRWAWWHGQPPADSRRGNEVQGYLIRVHEGRVSWPHPAPPAHEGERRWWVDRSGPRPVLHLWSGDRGELPGLGHALLHLEVDWPTGDEDWHHASATSGAGWPLGWAQGWAWTQRARPPW